jgi:hypothetical protein
MLKFSSANTKLKKLYKVLSLSSCLGKRKVYSLDLLSGFSCPFAQDCLAKAIVTAAKRFIKDGPKTKFRCFSASQEVLFPTTYNLRKHNFDLLRGKSEQEMFEIINRALPKNAGIVRIHVAGDFFCEAYLRAWIRVAEANPGVLFYAYTKSLSYWIKNKSWIDAVSNFNLTASFGGRLDHLIQEHNLRFAKVVFSELEAEELGLEIDHDDSHAALNGGSFALLIHGVQPSGSKAGKAVKALKGKGSYGKSSKAVAV